MEHIAHKMQAIVGGTHRTLKHDLESLEGAIKLWMYEHCDFTKADVDFVIQHLNPNMLQDLAECPNNLDVSKGQRHEGHNLATLWCRYVCEIMDLHEQCAHWGLQIILKHM